MREIKFRVWDNVDYMSTPFSLMDILYRRIEFTNDCDIMQFTGLLDKNKKEAYDSDIIKVFHFVTPNEFSVGVIKWDIQYACFKIQWVKSEQSAHRVGNYSFEVIGNIYENPELLDNLKEHGHEAKEFEL